MQRYSFFARCAASRHVAHVTQVSWRVAFAANQQPPSILLCLGLCSYLSAGTFAAVVGAPAPAANDSKVAVRLGRPMAGVGRSETDSTLGSSN